MTGNQVVLLLAVSAVAFGFGVGALIFWKRPV